MDIRASPDKRIHVFVQREKRLVAILVRTRNFKVLNLEDIELEDAQEIYEQLGEALKSFGN